MSARALFDRDLITLVGPAKSWRAKITPEGARRLAQEKDRRDREQRRARVAAERIRQKQEADARLRRQGTRLLEDVLAAGGRAHVSPGRFTSHDLTCIEQSIRDSDACPAGEMLTHEPHRMDEALGWSLYPRPDFDACISVSACTVPRQLRNPHPAVVAFQQRRQRVSKPNVQRAARLLQGIVNASLQRGWKVRHQGATASMYDGERQASDVEVVLPRLGVQVLVHELDQRGRTGRAFTAEHDHSGSSDKVLPSRWFQGSGRLQVTVSRYGWDTAPILQIRDESKTTVEDQVPSLVRALEIQGAEAEWEQRERQRKSTLREERRLEIYTEAVVKVREERNAEQATAQLEARRLAQRSGHTRTRSVPRRERSTRR